MYNGLANKSMLFNMLYRMQVAGIDAGKGWALLANDSELKVFKKDFKSMALLIHKGATVSHAGKVTGLWSDFEIGLIEVGEQSGKVESTYSQLADFYEQRGKRARTITSRMALPVFVFLLALFIVPLPKLFTGEITVAMYFSAILVRIFLILLVVVFGRFLYRYYLAGKFSEKIYQGCGKIPVLGRVITLQTQLDFLNYFYLCFSAGIPPIESAKLASRSLVNKYWSWRLLDVSIGLEKGQVITEALANAGVLSTSYGVQLMHAGEVSGRLEDMLKHYTNGLNDDLNLHWEYILDWMPRIVYATVILAMFL